jgi:DNA mismatch endonuclease, patch repair protein
MQAKESGIFFHKCPIHGTQMKEKLSMKTDRSAFMAKIRTKNTTPEIAVRKVTFSLGFRYRLHVGTLPGSPDLVFPKKRKVIFVHGCWWHQHSCQHGRTVAKTNTDFWVHKLAANVTRDRGKEAILLSNGWSVLVIWECQTKNKLELTDIIKRFLEDEERCNV